MFIVADIGGTNARFACADPQDPNHLSDIAIHPCADFTYLIDAIRFYLAETGQEVTGLCLAVAGPVDGDWIDLPNNHWAFSHEALGKELGVPVAIINDFSAQVLAVSGMKDDELSWVGEARPSGGKVFAVVGPGTGLGVSAMLPGGDILPSEGGHVGFAPTNEHEMALLSTLWRRRQRVSVERILSGMGLENLYWANCVLSGRERELPAAEITAGARAGDANCVAAINDFCQILASFAGDVALMTGALDGVYLSGGILPKIMDLLDTDSFRTRFNDKGRFQAANEATPLAFVLAKNPGLRGAARAAQLNAG
ncbi:MAG: glucokinase [Gammaproteobacteria bacterium]|nr:MAG: glucokinase [Gammaproteobacteria bacterium]